MTCTCGAVSALLEDLNLAAEIKGHTPVPPSQSQVLFSAAKLQLGALRGGHPTVFACVRTWFHAIILAVTIKCGSMF